MNKIFTISTTNNLVLLQSVAQALDEVISADVPKKSKAGENYPLKPDSVNDDVKISTNHLHKCPECGGRISLESRSDEKGGMTVYGMVGVRHVVHLEHRCIERHCRTGFYHGYRVLKGGIKLYEQNCLDPKQVCLGKQGAELHRKL